jgi:hypothetical protein
MRPAPIWVGLFTVTAPKDNKLLGGDAGACLWIAAQAEDATKLRTRVESVMKDDGLTVIEAEHLQMVEDEDELSEAVSELIPEARRNEQSVVCGTWHKFKYHDA